MTLRSSAAISAEMLPAIAEIGVLKARYCRFIDTKRWEDLRSLFVEDAKFEGLGSAPQGANLDMFINGISARFAQATSVHHCHMPDIVLTGADRARGTWAMMDYVQWPTGFDVAEVPGHPGFFGYGYYEEEYARRDGLWKISFLRLTRIRFDALPPGHPEPRPGKLQADPRWL